ncbi:MAG: hypothetical protein Q8Q67_00510 [bacterium]|nr:hypothetical protein [bacterium]
MYFVYGFSPAHIIVALSTALLLSVKSQSDVGERKIGIIAGTLLAAIPLSFWFESNEELSLLIIYITACSAALIYVLSHYRKEQLGSILWLFYFLISFSFASSAVNSLTLFAELIFWTIASAVILALVVTKIRKKVRAHRRARPISKNR